MLKRSISKCGFEEDLEISLYKKTFNQFNRKMLNTVRSIKGMKEKSNLFRQGQNIFAARNEFHLAAAVSGSCYCSC